MEHTFLLMPSISSSLFMLLLIMKLMLLLKTGKRFINYLLDPVLQISVSPSYELEILYVCPLLTQIFFSLRDTGLSFK